MLEMIENFGVGIDISSIKKFKDKPFNENKNFYNKIFSEQEIVQVFPAIKPYNATLIKS